MRRGLRSTKDFPPTATLIRKELSSIINEQEGFWEAERKAPQIQISRLMEGLLFTVSQVWEVGGEVEK